MNGIMQGIGRRSLLKAGLAGGTLALAGPLAVARAAGPVKIRLALGFQATGRFSPFYVALERGYYRDAGLDVEITPTNGNALAYQLLAADKADVVLADLMMMLQIQGREPGIHLLSLAVIQQKAPLALFYLESSGIRTPKDLEGKEIADSPGGNAQPLFPILAQVNGVDASKVTWKTAAAAAKVALMLNGEVPVASTYILGRPGIESKLQPGQKLGVFVYGDVGVDVYGDGIVTSRAFYDANQASAKAFVQATIRAYKEAFADPAAAASDMARHVPTLDNAVAVQEIEIVRELALGPVQQEKGIGYHEPEKMAASYKAVVENLQQPIARPVTELYTNDAL